jgi:hypothetical protein
MWRKREDGSTFNQRSGSLFFSVPLIISVDTTNTLFPYHPNKHDVCSNTLIVLLPHLEGQGQDPNMCGTRSLPVVDSMNYQDSVKYCLINLPEGLKITDVP